MVYVISKNGNPLMPTTRHGKVRILLKEKKAEVIKREPFTIQLLYDTPENVQEITLGVDAGSRCIGLSATTEAKELFSAEIELRADIVALLSDRKQYRRSRRNRKTRYRKPRFLNRVKSKKDGWLAPSIQNKIDAHIRAVYIVFTLLPVSRIIVEVASFDIQKIKNPNIDGIGYHQGDQLGFWNVREYVLWRDGHKCHGRKGCQEKILNIHHIESRKTGGDSPSNLISMCEKCHKNYHEGLLKLDLKRGQSYVHETFMGIMRWTFYNRLKQLYSDVQLTYGYITKHTRIINNLPKAHRVDALCISGNPMAEPLKHYYFFKQVRRHNRQLHKANILKGGVRRLNQAPYEVKGFRLFDKVRYQGVDGFIFGRRISGYFDIRKLDGTVVRRSASYKALKIVQTRRSFLMEMRKADPYPTNTDD